MTPYHPHGVGQSLHITMSWQVQRRHGGRRGADTTGPTVLLEPPGGHIYTTETVNLECHAKDSSPDWTYQWFHHDQSSPVVSTSDLRHTIGSANLSDTGQYWCKIKRGEHLSAFKLPKPTLQLRTEWLDVFPSERVELSCELPGAANWTFAWYRDEQPSAPDGQSVTATAEGSLLAIPQATPTHGGRYACEALHKARRISSERSNVETITWEVLMQGHARQPSVLYGERTESKGYRERVELNCGVEGSSEWKYVWYRGGEPIQAEGGRVVLAAGGTTLSIPAALDVHAGHERVELNCGVEGSSEWKYVWYRGGEPIQAEGGGVVLAAGGTTLSIPAALDVHAGQYTCMGQHKSRAVSTSSSADLTLKVYGDRPSPILRKDPDVEPLYAGESVSLSCQVDVSSGWEYRWYKDGGQHPVEDSRLNISSLAPSDSGRFSCKATRGNPQFSTENALSLKVIGKNCSERVELNCGVEGSSEWKYVWYRGGEPIQAEGGGVVLAAGGTTLSIPAASDVHAGQYTCMGRHKSRAVSTDSSADLTLKVYGDRPSPILQKDPDVEPLYAGESVSLSCQVHVSSGWEYRWYKDGGQLPDSSERVELNCGVEGSSEWKYVWYRGGEPIQAEGGRVVLAAGGTTLSIPAALDVHAGHERVELNCGVEGSSEWKYVWYRGGELIQAEGGGVVLAAGGTTLSIPAALDVHAGQYTCMGRHKSRAVSTDSSAGLTLEVYGDRPSPTLRKDPGFEPFERVELNCGVEGSSEWKYVWYRGGKQIQAEGGHVVLAAGGTTLSIPAASDVHAGQYMCRGRHKSRAVSTSSSAGLTLKVYAIPKPTMKLSTPWSDVFPSERVELNCGVEGSSEWKYVWYRGGEPIQAEGGGVVLAAGGTTLSIPAASDATDPALSYGKIQVFSPCMLGSLCPSAANGRFSCKATRGNPQFSTENTLSLKVIAEASESRDATNSCELKSFKY
ncbi:hypothetical protein NHX12_012635 [Muraenolepis orangiensis]|uniref:Ig-like domain-containing protein n=1 Tax=Muraenolepis orangiensis TaxID=630683 RepID=A0A9Q0DFU1_9TELE|nr:hypothetical protein NHX12_012635 [Muraenolepis orangiensis]